MSAAQTPMDSELLRQMGALNLAHVGDAVYELLVRTRLARQGAQRLSDQHRAAVSYVSAPAQAAAAQRIAPLLTEEERAVYKRGRNARVHGVPSGCTTAQYHAATGLEALMGWLWLSGRTDRIEALFASIVES